MINRILCIVLSLAVLLFCVIPVGVTYADENKTAQMIKFFRESRLSLDVDAVSKDEVMVYGVFLSNFFVPGKTKLGDLKDSSKSLANRVSEKFFGNTSNSDDVQKIHSKIYDALSKQFSNVGTQGVLRLDANTDPMSGKDLLGLLYSPLAAIYLDGQQFNLDSSGLRHAFSILAGIYPNALLDVNSGAAGSQRVYVDGFGNIWGSRQVNTHYDDYVLILPACLNPLSFAGGNNEFRLPLNNVFAMGVVPQLSQSVFSSSTDSDKLLPYYNMKQGFYSSRDSQSNFDTLNFLTIVGVNSVHPDFGKNTIFEVGNIPVEPRRLADYYTAPVESRKVGSESIMLAFDLSNSKGLSSLLVSLGASHGSDWTPMGQDEIQSLAKELFATRFIPLSKTWNTMYYFNTGGAASAEGESWAGSGLNKGMLEQSLFAANDESYFSGSIVIPNTFSVYMRSKEGNSELARVLRGEQFSNMTADEWVNREQPTIASVGDQSGGGSAHIFPESKFKYNVQTGGVSLFGIIPLWRDNGEGAFGFNLNNPEALLGIGGKIRSSGSSVNAAGDVLKFYVDMQQRVTSMFHQVYGYKLFGLHPSVRNQLRGDNPASGAGAEGVEVYSSVANEVNNFPGIYWGYMVRLLGIGVNDEGKMTASPYVNAVLPKLDIAVGSQSFNPYDSFDQSGVISGGKQELEEARNDIIKKTAAILSEGENPYRDRLINDVQDSWVLSNHRRMVGNTGVSGEWSTDSAYKVSSGFVSMPTLMEYGVTRWVSENFLALFITVMGVALVYLVLYTLYGKYELGQAILLWFMVALIVFSPVLALTWSIDTTNKVSTSSFSGKFDYWALVQHQRAFSALQDSSDNSAVAESMQSALDIYRRDGSIRIKWMSPKKEDIFNQIFSSSRVDSSLATRLVLFRYLMASYLYQDEYVGGLDTYIYRPYNSIAQAAKQGYDRIKNLSLRASGVPVASKSMELMVEASNVPYTPDVVQDIQSVGVTGFRQGDSYYFYRYAPLMLQVLSDRGYNDDMDLAASGAGMDSVTLANSGEGGTFLLYTESPYYYFYNSLKSRYGEGDSFKSHLANINTYRHRGSGGKDFNNYRKDFLDMEGLFTYVIPYLSDMNNYVDRWGKKYGLDVERFDLRETDPTPEVLSAINKKKAVSNIWTIYSPWVDVLNTNYGRPESIMTLKGSRGISSPIRAYSYREAGRDMFFSPADMIAKGYNAKSLSSVEQRIFEVLEKTEKDMFYLTNYYDLDNEVLLSAAAMHATFNFSDAFGRSGWFSERRMFPNGYELRNFSFDSLLRLGLLNATGEPMMSTKDLYARVISGTGLGTGLMLLLNDLFGVYIVPFAKMAMVFITYIAFIMVALSLLVRVHFSDTPIRDFLYEFFNRLVKPTVGFTLLNVSFALLVSMIVGNGLTQYTGAPEFSFNVGSAHSFLTFLAGLSLSYCVLAVIFCKRMFKGVKEAAVEIRADLANLGNLLRTSGMRVLGAKGGGGSGASYLDGVKSVGNQTIDGADSVVSGVEGKEDNEAIIPEPKEGLNFDVEAGSSDEENI